MLFLQHTMRIPNRTHTCMSVSGYLQPFSTSPLYTDTRLRQSQVWLAATLAPVWSVTCRQRLLPHICCHMLFAQACCHMLAVTFCFPHVHTCYHTLASTSLLPHACCLLLAAHAYGYMLALWFAATWFRCNLLTCPCSVAWSGAAMAPRRSESARQHVWASGHRVTSYETESAEPAPPDRTA
jgi:hypothetical protein